MVFLRDQVAVNDQNHLPTPTLNSRSVQPIANAIRDRLQNSLDRLPKDRSMNRIKLLLHDLARALDPVATQLLRPDRVSPPAWQIVECLTVVDDIINRGTIMWVNKPPHIL